MNYSPMDALLASDSKPNSIWMRRRPEPWRGDQKLISCGQIEAVRASADQRVCGPGTARLTGKVRGRWRATTVLREPKRLA